MSLPVIEIVSFGYLHGAPPEGAHLTLDLRTHFRDPHVNPELREMTARDEPVKASVMATAGIREMVTAFALAVLAFSAGPADAPLLIAVGCAGGRHRAPVVVDALADELGLLGFTPALTHRDLEMPIVVR
ncbi:RapZ C-terminal domain-containing protein [Kitasatospora sp. NPDC001664]